MRKFFGDEMKKIHQFRKIPTLGDPGVVVGVVSINYFNKIGRCAFPLTSPVRGAAAKVVMTWC